MTIPKQLPQYMNTPTLLLVLGEQHGTAYLCKDGTLQELFSHMQPVSSKYDLVELDTSPFAKVDVDTQTAQRNCAAERRAFIDTVRTQVESVDQAYDLHRVVLCAPRHIADAVEWRISSSVRRKIGRRLFAQLTNEDPCTVMARMYQPHKAGGMKKQVRDLWAQNVRHRHGAAVRQAAVG